MQQSLAIFDLDNTLIAGDSDYLWGEFLIQHKLVDVVKHQAENKKFFIQYNQGDLDINEWLKFQLQPLTQYSFDELNELNTKFINSKIKPIILEFAINKINHHRKNNDELLIISATNYFITKPIAQLLNIKNLIATKPEIIANQYTGKVNGIITYQHGKIIALDKWLVGKKFKQTYFYSDSHNDLPLLNKVDVPVAVDPDNILHAAAIKNNWQIISFRKI